MTESRKDLYAASCNPPRRAKRAPIPTPDETSPTSASSVPPQHRAILPMRPYAPRATTTATETVPPPPPAKRGRKPGPLSRTAREAQRRLNHSIIEKARRTKINDALATLKELVPVNYGQQKQTHAESRDEDEDDEDEDDDYDDGTKKPKPKPKGSGKKEEKEKEFKLEILVRTVSFLQDLLERVAVLEANAAPACQNCDIGKDQKKRKRIHLEEDDQSVPQDTRVLSRSAKIPRHSERAPDSAINETPDIIPVPSSVFVLQASQPSAPSSQVQTSSDKDAASARLPSISSWLHNNSVIDPQLLPAQAQTRSSPPAGSYLPSPPASTTFDPVRMSAVPPLLNLGPVATAAMVSPSRTPEDESAASLLLQISASSPTFRSVSSPTNYNLPDPSGFFLHPDGRSQRDGHCRQAQTPSSLLGLSTTSRRL